MNIILSFDNRNQSSEPAGFRTTIQSVADFFNATYTDNVRINIDVGYGFVGKTSTVSGLGNSSTNTFINLGYTTLKNALQNDQITANDQTAFASLPATDPFNLGNQYSVSRALSKALNLGFVANPSTDTGLDGSIGIGNGFTYDTDRSNGISANAFDLYGIFAHELTEVLGRGLNEIGNAVATGGPHIEDLFHFSDAAGHARTNSGTTKGYFSINGGATNLGSYNTSVNGDFGDWADPGHTPGASNYPGNDSFNAFGSTGVANLVSENDLIKMDILGYNRGVPPPTPVLAITAVDANKAEGTSGGTTPFTFTVTRTGSTSGTSTVFWQVNSGQSPSADANDFSGATSGTLTFNAGDTSKTIILNVIADTTVEPTENFAIGLSNAAGATIDQQHVSAGGAIQNDDQPPSHAEDLPIIRAVPAYFNSDANSDLLWRNDDGNVGTWDMNDHQVLSTFSFGQVPTAWHIAGTGDFNGDGKTDILWRNDDGNVGTWDMNDHQILSTFSFGLVPTAWHIAGTGDFNGDGKTDILWRNDDGNVGTWDMNDHQILSAFSFGPQPNAWHIAGIGDFNGDGTSDILWRNDDGNVGTWDMNDHLVSAFAFGPQPNAWHIAGTGDFNGDHRSDILWRNDDGNVGTWDMNDHQVLSTFAFGPQPNAWHIAGTGDFNGDHRSDILWRNDDGNVGTWDLNDHQILSAFAFGTQPGAWHLV